MSCSITSVKKAILLNQTRYEVLQLRKDFKTYRNVIQQVTSIK